MKFDGFFSIDGSNPQMQPENNLVRVHGYLADVMPVCTLSGFIAKSFAGQQDNPDFYNDPRVALAGRIIRLQVALYLTRRTILCQSVSDGFF